MKALKLDSRFWSKVQPEPMTGCWLWIACVNAHGYGKFRQDGRAQRSHRLSFAHHYGWWPKVVDHVCHTPACVNPEHLRAATQKQNSHNTRRHSDGSSRYKGVGLVKIGGRRIRERWRAQITVSGRYMHLGNFDHEEDAARAYDQAAVQFFGEYAKTNVGLGLLPPVLDASAKEMDQ